MAKEAIKTRKQLEETTPVVRPTLQFSPTRYRVKASDRWADGSSFASAVLGSVERAWDFVDWLKAQSDRFTLIRIEACREAMVAPEEEVK